MLRSVKTEALPEMLEKCLNSATPLPRMERAILEEVGRRQAAAHDDLIEELRGIGHDEDPSSSEREGEDDQSEAVDQMPGGTRPVRRATGSRLRSEEREVLGALIVFPGVELTERTVAGVAARTGIDEAQVLSILNILEATDPPAVRRDTDARLDVEFWTALDPATELLAEG